MFFFNEKLGWIAGDGIWNTSDGGETWKEQLSLPASSHPLESVFFVNGELGWAQSLGGVWRTTNGGRNWSKVSEDWLKRLDAQPSEVAAHRFQPKAR